MTARRSLSCLLQCLHFSCVAFLLAGSCSGQTRLVLSSGGNVSTLAGTGIDSRTVSGPGASASLGSPRGLTYDSTGNLYVADAKNHQIDRITPSGALTIVAGTGGQGFSGDGGPATAAELNEPTALVLSTDGTLFVADTGNQCIRRINSTGSITTVAGNGQPGFSGDGGAGIAARLRAPSGLALGADGALYISDTGNHRVRKLTADGLVTTVAGSGVEDDTGDDGPAKTATLKSPGALEMLADGRLLIADRAAHRIRALSPDGTIMAYATGGALRRPEGLGVDAAGNLLIADAAGQQVIQTGPDASSRLSATYLAGTGRQGAFNAGPANKADFDSPAAVATNSSTGDVAISDRRNHQVQRAALPALAYGDIPAGKVSAAQSLTLENGGNTELSVAAMQLPSGFSSVSNGATCPAFPFTLKPAATCTLAIAFAPNAQGPLRGYAQILSIGTPSAAVLLSGIATAPGGLTSSVTTLQTNGTISYAGSPVLLTAKVTGTLQSSPIGNITFYDGPTLLATAALTNGSISLSTAAMQPGQHSLHAVYSGDALYSSSTSASITQTVVLAPDFAVTMAASSYNGKAGETISIPFSIAPANGTLNHTMQLSVSGLPAGFIATVTPSIFTLGANPTNVTIEIKIPTVLAFGPSHNSSPMLLAALSACLFCFCRKGKRHVSVALLVVTAALCCGGCGGGIRPTTAGSGVDGTPKTFRYTAVVTATTTGILGDTLTHSTNIGLVVTQ